jgi:hypothetical protein
MRKDLMAATCNAVAIENNSCCSTFPSLRKTVGDSPSGEQNIDNPGQVWNVG